MAVQVTEAEWKIMEVLWDHSPRTMTEITAILEPTTGWTRHTVITLLKRMLEKGSISMDDTERAKKYTPLITREEASNSCPIFSKGRPHFWSTIWLIPVICQKKICSRFWMS